MKHHYLCYRLTPNVGIGPYIVESQDELSAKQQMQKLFPDDADFKVVQFSRSGSTSVL